METKVLMGAGLALSMATAAWAGGTAEETRDVKSFSEVVIHGSMDAEIETGKEQSVRIVADDDIIDKIITEVRGDRLHLKLKRGRYYNIDKMTVYITVPELKGGSIHGSGDMEITGGIDGDFDFSIHGSGNAEIDDVTASELDLAIHGSGNIKMDGSCEVVEASVHGSGDVKARDLKCGDADIDIHGSGDVAMQVKGNLKAEIYGSGDVDLYGGAPNNQRTKVRGSGDITVH